MFDFNQQIKLFMQSKEKKIFTLERISIKRPSLNRKALPIPVVIAHDNEKKKKEHDKLKRIICARFKHKRNLSKMLEIVENNPPLQNSVLKNRSSRKFYDIDRSTQTQKSLSHHYIKIKQQVLRQQTKLSSQSFMDANLKTQNAILKNFLRKLSKTQIGANLNEIMQQKESNLQRKSLSKIFVTQFDTLRSSLSCKLMPYNKSSEQVRRRLKKSNNNCQDQKSYNKSSEKYRYELKSLQIKSKYLQKEEQLEGWETNQPEKQGSEFNNCSLQTFQL